MITITDWSLEFAYPSNGYTAPELRGLRLVGVVNGHPQKTDGKRVATSPIVKVAGRTVRTESGTEYELVGDPCAAYLEWLREQGRTYDPDEPIKTARRKRRAAQ